jgi:hypothetical protein
MADPEPSTDEGSGNLNNYGMFICWLAFRLLEFRWL